MKVSILAGSGHPNSRSYQLACYEKEFLEKYPDMDVQIYNICDFDVKECLGCEYCLAHQGICIIQDDQMKIFYDLFYQSDRIIINSPVYFSNLPATLKKVIDRCQLFYNLKDKSPIKEKKILAVHYGGAKEYPSQYSAFEDTYRVLLPDIKGTLQNLVTFSGVDTKSLMDDTEFLEKLETELKILTKEK